MIIKILGTGCDKCKKLTEQTQEAIAQLNIEVTIQKVMDINEIITYGVLITPALVINEEVKVAGRIPSIDEVKRIIQDTQRGKCSCGGCCG